MGITKTLHNWRNIKYNQSTEEKYSNDRPKTWQHFIWQRPVKNHDNIEITHLNLNDDSIEGIRLKNKPAFSVQYHPEATPGPHDSRYLFDDFVAMMTAN